MKKILLLTSLLLISILTKAQFRVDSLGNASIGIDADSLAKFSVKNDSEQYGVRLQSKYKDILYGLYSTVSTSKTGSTSGLRSYVYSSKTTSYAAAIEGYTTCGTLATGVSFGVIGRMGNLNNRRRGVGIYGSYNAGIMTNYVDTTYAGFFYGRTKVYGNLTVTGQIRGSLLSNSPSSGNPENPSSVLRTENRLSDKFRSLKAVSYMYESPKRALYQTPDEEDSNEEDSSSDVTNEEEELSGIERQLLEKQHYGLSADQLEEVFPDLVYEQEDGTKSINYVEMVPILVQAINELKGEIEELRAGGDGETKKDTKANSEGDSAEKLLLLSLGQNKPNPFSNATTIEVCIPEDVQKAFIYVYDLQGKKVDQVDITARGKQNIQLTSANLADGMYLYSLIADGKVVETRRMIVEK